MHINYAATEGVKLLGSEDGAWMSDGIDNGLQTLISGGFKETRTTEGNYTKTAHTWTEVPGGSGGTISVTNDVITITQSAATTMYVHTPITCVIGDVYSVSAYVLSSNTVANIRVSDDTSGGADRVGLATGNSDLGLFTATFTATQTTHYISLVTTNNDTEVKFKNEVEIREAEIITGAELVTNGDFATDSDWIKGTGWTIAAGVATHAAGTAGALEQAISLTGGKSYIIVYTLSGVTAGNIFPYFYSPSVVGTVRSANGTYVDTLVAAEGNTIFYLHASGAFDGSVDDVTVRLAIPDLSSVNQGLGVYGSLNKHVVNVNADTVSYSGFSNSNYLRQPYSSDLEPDSTDISCCGWLKVTDQVSTAGPIFYWGGSNAEYYMTVNTAGTVGFTINSTGAARSVTSTATVEDNDWHHIFGTYDQSAGTLYLYIDGDLENTATGAVLGAVTDATATLTIGNNSVPNAFFNGEIDLVKIDAGVLFTESQIKTIYNKEKLIFQRDRMHTVIGTTYDLDITPESTSRSTEIKRQSNTSIGGSTETLFQRNDKMWDFTTGNIHYLDIKYIRNCLDSIANGQTFTFDAYGTTASATDPKNSTYESNFYAENRSGTTQYFKVGAKIREI